MLTDLVASFTQLEPNQRQELLETFDLKTRLNKVLELLRRRIEVLRLSREIGEKAKESIDQRQREFLLREQLRAIQEQLGEGEEKSEEIAELGKAIAGAKMPDDVEKQASPSAAPPRSGSPSGQDGSRLIDAPDIPAILGPRRFEREIAERTSVPGVPTGLAWTSAGGTFCSSRPREFPAAASSS